MGDAELFHGVTAETGSGRTDEAMLVGSDRVLALIKGLAGCPDGASLEELTRMVVSPKPTVHRALTRIGAPIARPRQILCIGLNYRDQHVMEQR